MEQRGQSPHRTGNGAGSGGGGAGRGTIGGASLDTVLEENRDGNDTHEHHRPDGQSHCAQVCAHGALRDDLPGNVRCHRVAAQNQSQQIQRSRSDVPIEQDHTRWVQLSPQAQPLPQAQPPPPQAQPPPPQAQPKFHHTHSCRGEMMSEF